MRWLCGHVGCERWSETACSRRALCGGVHRRYAVAPSLQDLDVAVEPAEFVEQIR